MTPPTATHELPTVAELAAAHDLRDSSVYRLSEACELVLDELAQRRSTASSSIKAKPSHERGV